MYESPVATVSPPSAPYIIMYYNIFNLYNFYQYQAVITAGAFPFLANVVGSLLSNFFSWFIILIMQQLSRKIMTIHALFLLLVFLNSISVNAQKFEGLETGCNH
jgi:hypothetical protein